MLRPALSAASKAGRAFSEIPGIRRIDVHLVTCRAVKGVPKIWERLEAGLLATFHKQFGQLPCYNKKGTGNEIEDIKYFRPGRLAKIIGDLSR